MTERENWEDWPTPSIQTYTGIEFYPLSPDWRTIDPADIAHALALKCRYTGHCEFFFSVAQHSVLLADFMLYCGCSEMEIKWALLHDASEAYLPDIAGPIKPRIPGFKEIERTLLYAVAQRFELSWPMTPELKHMDRLMYWRERSVLLKDVDWIKAAVQYEAVPEPMTNHVPIVEWSPARAKETWIDRFLAYFPDEKRETW